MLIKWNRPLATHTAIILVNILLKIQQAEGYNSINYNHSSY